MGLEDRPSRGTQGKSTEIILISEKEEPKFPKVRGVYFENNYWVVDSLYKKKWKRFYFSGDASGYSKAVKLKEKINQEKIKLKIKELFGKG